MLDQKMKPFSISCLFLVIAIASVICIGCSGTVRSKATTFKEPLTDPDIRVDVYVPNKVFPGTTLFADNHKVERPRIIEVDMQGRIVWEYVLPWNLREYTKPGLDVEWLPNNNILFVLPLHGVYEINRNGDIVWSYLDMKVSHDADRLPNGNTLVVWGGSDKKNDAQVKEINNEGKVVWAWYAKDHFDKMPYKDIYREGWTHTNAASRLPNGNTLISPRNFNLMIEVDPVGSVVRTIENEAFINLHDPELLPNGNILVANHRRRHRAIEVDPKTNEIVWKSLGFKRNAIPVRDADRLPNGNILITGTSKIVEVNKENEIVWQLNLENIQLDRKRLISLGFYKAQRIALQ